MNAHAADFEEEEQAEAAWRWVPLRKIRVPVDEIAPEHEGVHQLLLRWGAWNRERSGGSSLASIEATYTKGDIPPATAPLSADPEIMDLELTVIRLMVNEITAAHMQTLLMLYVKNFAPFTICRALRIRYEFFPRWTWTAREMVRVAMVVRRYGT